MKKKHTNISEPGLPAHLAPYEVTALGKHSISPQPSVPYETECRRSPFKGE